MKKVESLRAFIHGDRSPDCDPNRLIVDLIDQASDLADYDLNMRFLKELIMKYAQAQRELTEKQRRLNEDLEAAAGIQKSLLPHKLPESDRIAFASEFHPCALVGGDIFNVVELDEHHLGMYMIDVSGHGVQSALITVSLSQRLQPNAGILVRMEGQTPVINPPDRVLETLDLEYPLERFNSHFTMTYGILDCSNGVFVFSNAGHPSPLLLRGNGDLECLDRGGSIIGLGGLVPFESGKVVLSGGDKIVLYTDGITEHRNSDGEFYGEERLISSFHKNLSEPIRGCLKGLLKDVMWFGRQNDPEDDISILGFEYRA